jgi:VanZ family protein
MPPVLPNLDKLVHACEYGLLAFLFARAVRATSLNASVPLIFAITLYFVVFYGITDEFHQSFVPGRSADLQDLMADTLGGAVATIIYLFRQRKLTATI